MPEEHVPSFHFLFFSSFLKEMERSYYIVYTLHCLCVCAFSQLHTFWMIVYSISAHLDAIYLYEHFFNLVFTLQKMESSKGVEKKFNDTIKIESSKRPNNRLKSGKGTRKSRWKLPNEKWAKRKTNMIEFEIFGTLWYLVAILCDWLFSLQFDPMDPLLLCLGCVELLLIARDLEVDHICP